MNKKRLVAYVAAATMLLNATPVMANQIVTGPIATASGSSTITGSGTVTGADVSDIFQVTLPTSVALNFDVDPYGLLNLASGEAVSADNLPTTGTILSASGCAAMIKNESSVPVSVDITLQAVASGNATFVTGASLVVSEDDPNLFLSLVPSATKSAVESSGVTGYVTSSAVIPVISTTATTTRFQLQNAEYELVKGSGAAGTFRIVSDSANYDSTVFKVGGVVNSAADWSDFVNNNSSVSMTAKFSFAKSPDGEELDDTLDVYGLVSGQAVKFTDDTSPANSNEYTWTSGDLSVTIPAGAKRLEWVEIDGKETLRNLVVSSYDGGTTLVIPASAFNGPWSVGKLRITYPDASTVFITVTNGN